MPGYLIWGLTVYGLLLVLLYVAQRGLLYYPDPTVPDPAQWGVPEMTPLRIEAEADVRLLAWWRAPVDPDRPVLLYFHGNAGHLGYRGMKVRPYLDAGYGVLLVSYRYNADAGGRPSEKGLYADGAAAFAYLRRQGIPTERIVLYGESLGSAVAVHLAAEQRVGAVVLEAPFTSIAAVAQHHYWYAPAKWLLRDKFDAGSRIGRATAPILILYGERDRIVPPKFSRGLFDLAPEPKEIEAIPDAGHNDLYDYDIARYVLEFLERHLR